MLTSKPSSLLPREKGNDGSMKSSTAGSLLAEGLPLERRRVGIELAPRIRQRPRVTILTDLEPVVLRMVVAASRRFPRNAS